MDDFELIEREVSYGLVGKNSNIPMGFNRLNKYIGLRKRIMTLIFGATGSGKSSLTTDSYILNPFEYYLKNKDTLKMKVIYFSMERSKVFTLCKWLIRKIFLDTGILIPMGKLLGWWDIKLTKNEHDLVLQYGDYIRELTSSYCTIIEGAQNPTGIYKTVKKYAEENGTIEHIDEFRKIYIPNHSNEIVIPIIDHLGITKLEGKLSNRKEAIDKTIEYCQFFRDFYGHSPVLVSQIVRELGSVQYQKMGDFEPTIDHIKESGAIAEACDQVLSIFDPLRYNTTDKFYDASKFRDNTNGAKHFRNIKLLKNTYGEDSISIGMVMHGSTGIFKELPKKEAMQDYIYEDVLNGKYFINK